MREGERWSQGRRDLVAGPALRAGGRGRRGARNDRRTRSWHAGTELIMKGEEEVIRYSDLGAGAGIRARLR